MPGENGGNLKADLHSIAARSSDPLAAGVRARTNGCMGANFVLIVSNGVAVR